MLNDFSKYTKDEVKTMVVEAFNTVEKTGVMDDTTSLSKTWADIRMEPSYISDIAVFLEDLYREFATRYNLYTSYRNYLRAAIKDEICKECEEKQKRIEELEFQMNMIISDNNIDMHGYRF